MQQQWLLEPINIEEGKPENNCASEKIKQFDRIAQI